PGQRPLGHRGSVLGRSAAVRRSLRSSRQPSQGIFYSPVGARALLLSRPHPTLPAPPRSTSPSRGSTIGRVATCLAWSPWTAAGIRRAKAVRMPTVTSGDGIPYRRLGRTGEMVSLIGLGGYHLGRQADEQEAIRIVRTGVDNGINFLDNCWDYHGGASEIRMGKALSDGHRGKAFLQTKRDSSTKRTAARKIT